MRRLIAWLCTVALLVSMGSTALAAEDTSAAVLRLQSSSGAVTVTNQTGRTLTTQNELRLQNGYTITTGAASYAYISLDDTKAVKLDSLTTCTVVKQGTKLELLLEAGQLFFNVTSPLKAEETLNIRTSTMATGIRGTSGSASTDGIFISSLCLFTGSATVSTVNSTGILSGQAALTQGVSTMEIVAGQEAYSSRNGSTGQTELNLITNQGEDYSAFELQSILEQEGLLDEILGNDNTVITQELFEDVDTLLAADELAQTEWAQSITAEQETQTSGDATIETSTTASSGGTTVSTGGSSSSGNSTTNSAEDDLIESLEAGTTTITLTEDVTLTEKVDVPADTTLVIDSGATLTVDADLTIYGTVSVEDGIIVNNELVYVFSTNSLDVAYDGQIQNNGTIFVGATAAPGAMTVDGSVTGGMISVGGSSTLTLQGYGEIDETDIYTTDSGARFTMTGGTLDGGTSLMNIVHVSQGTFTLSGGTVEHNSTSGAAVLVMGGTVTMTGGTISTGSQGAVELSSGTFNMTGGLLQSYSGVQLVTFEEGATVNLATLDTDVSDESAPTIRAKYSSASTTASDLITVPEGYTATVYVSTGNDGFHYLETYESGTTTYFLTFMNGTEVYEVRGVESGTVVADDDVPTIESDDSYLEGWYLDEACIKPWDNSDAVTENLTLYANMLSAASGTSTDDRLSNVAVVYDASAYTMTVSGDTAESDGDNVTYEVFGILNQWNPGLETSSEAVLYGHAGTVADPAQSGETVFYFTVAEGESFSYDIDGCYLYDDCTVEMVMRTQGEDDLSENPTVMSYTLSDDDDDAYYVMWVDAVFYGDEDTLYLYTYDEVDESTLTADGFSYFTIENNKSVVQDIKVTGITCTELSDGYSRLTLTLDNTSDIDVTDMWLQYNGDTITNTAGDPLYCDQMIETEDYTATSYVSSDGKYIYVALNSGYVTADIEGFEFTVVGKTDSEVEAIAHTNYYVSVWDMGVYLTIEDDYTDNTGYTVTITPPVMQLPPRGKRLRQSW